MDKLTDRAIELAATHAGEFTRLMGRQEQERRDLIARHVGETRALRVEEGLSPDESDPEPAATDIGQAIAMLRGLFGGNPLLDGRLSPETRMSMGGVVGGPPELAGPVVPPSDAPPGVPLELVGPG